MDSEGLVDYVAVVPIAGYRKMLIQSYTSGLSPMGKFEGCIISYKVHVKSFSFYPVGCMYHHFCVLEQVSSSLMRMSMHLTNDLEGVMTSAT